MTLCFRFHSDCVASVDAYVGMVPILFDAQASKSKVLNKYNPLVGRNSLCWSNEIDCLFNGSTILHFITKLNANECNQEKDFHLIWQKKKRGVVN